MKGVGHHRPDRRCQLTSGLVVETRGGDRVQEVKIDDAGSNVKRTFRHYLAGSVDDRRDDGRLGRDGEDKGALLEGTQMIVETARAFRADDDRAAGLHRPRGDFVRLERRLQVVAVDEHDADDLRGEAEERDFSQLRFGDEAAPGHFGGEREDVEPADVVGDVNRTLAGGHPLAVDADPHAGRPVHRARPQADTARIDRVGALRYTKEPSDDDDRAEHGRHQQRDQSDK